MRLGGSVERSQRELLAKLDQVPGTARWPCSVKATSITIDTKQSQLSAQPSVAPAIRPAAPVQPSVSVAKAKSAPKPAKPTTAGRRRSRHSLCRGRDRALGFRAVPIMTAGAAYDLCQVLGWEEQPARKAARGEDFLYICIAGFTLLAAGMNFLGS